MKRCSKFFLRLLIAAVVFGCKSEDEEGTNDSADAAVDDSMGNDFVEYFADGSAWCSKRDDCGFDTAEACLSDWISEARVLEALQKTAWTDDQSSACMEASKALDECYFALSCADAKAFNRGQSTSCDDLGTAFTSQCDMFLKQVSMLPSQAQ